LLFVTKTWQASEEIVVARTRCCEEREEEYALLEKTPEKFASHITTSASKEKTRNASTEICPRMRTLPD